MRTRSHLDRPDPPAPKTSAPDMGDVTDTARAPLASTRESSPRARRSTCAAIAATPPVVVSDLPDTVPMTESEIHLVLGSLAAHIDALFTGDP